MELGSGIAIAGVCVALASAILKFVPGKNKSNPDSGDKELEVVHKRIGERQTVIMCDEKMGTLEEKTGRIEATGLQTNSIVMEILGKIKI